MIHQLSRPGGRIAYRDTGGDGPLVIVVPGLGDTKDSFRFIAPALEQAGNRVVSMDLRGHGESDATFDTYTPEDIGGDIVALLRHLDAGPALVIGVSIASDAAIWAAAEAPDYVNGLVLIRAYPPGTSTSRALLIAMKVLLARPWGALAWSKIFASFFPTKPPADLASYQRKLRTMLRESGRLQATWAMMSSSKEVAHARISDVSQPALVVMGSADQGDPEAEGRSVAEALEGELELIEQAGHYPHVEFPDETWSAIEKFHNGLKNA